MSENAMKNIDAIRERLVLLLSELKTNPNSISSQTGYPQPNLQKQIYGTTKVSVDTILVILELYPQVSPDWLLLGNGSTYRSSSAPTAIVTGSAGSVINQGTAKTISTDPSLRDLYESIKKKDQQIEKLIDLLTNRYPSTLS